ADVHQLDAVIVARLHEQTTRFGVAVVGVLPGEQTLAQQFQGLFGLAALTGLRDRFFIDDDEVIHTRLADQGAQLAADALPQDVLRPLRGADALDETVYPFLVGDAPADIRLDGEGLVHGVARRVVSEQLGGRQVEYL